MRKFVPFAFLVITGLATLGCEDDLFLCDGGECVTQEQCFDSCLRECPDGAFNLAGYECTLEGQCICECFLGCGVLDPLPTGSN